jgi:hypothetical protein
VVPYTRTSSIGIKTAETGAGFVAKGPVMLGSQGIEQSDAMASVDRATHLQ